MEIQITAKCFKAAQKKNPNIERTGWGTNDTHINVVLDNMEIPQLEELRDIMKDHDEKMTRQVSKLINALKDPDNKTVPSLRDFPRLLQAYLRANGNPWLHSLEKEMRGAAFLPIECEHRTSNDRRSKDEWVTLKLAYNAKLAFKTYVLHINKGDMHQTVPQILRRHNLVVPDESLIEDHEKVMARFDKFCGQHAEQFWIRGKAVEIGGDDWWSHSRDLDLSYAGKPTKGVLDFDKVESNKLRSTYRGDIYEREHKVPTHPILPVFSLAHHKYVWVNVCNMGEYKYEEGIMDRLVLPQSHQRLISALVSNLDVLRMESEVEEKSRTIRAKASSAIILAKGPVGTGKTLTAEVYAEEIKRPIYEVQSGQIGTEPEEIEENLRKILARSVRLRMPLLINEADVFVQERGRDLHQNAVVSVFLRLLEYHTGLVFLNTNRADDIDDGILSRCIAQIAYTTPGPNERKRLWSLLLREFNVELSDADLERVVHVFPKVAGRDIQNLIRLTSRVCAATDMEFGLKALKECAIFRGIVLDKDTK
jgi:hypothetical protein